MKLLHILQPKLELSSLLCEPASLPKANLRRTEVSLITPSSSALRSLSIPIQWLEQKFDDGAFPVLHTLRVTLPGETQAPRWAFILRFPAFPALESLCYDFPVPVSDIITMIIPSYVR